jgi:hypothetical protein
MWWTLLIVAASVVAVFAVPCLAAVVGCHLAKWLRGR